MRPFPALLPLALAACSPASHGSGNAACGIAFVAGPALVLSEFNTPGATLRTPPATLPGTIVARFVAGPAQRAIVGRRGDSLEVGIDGGIPAAAHPGFGVLTVTPSGRAIGVLVFDGTPILAAPHLGAVTVGTSRIPLLGVTIDSARVQDPRCPSFPDSVLQ